MTPARALAQSLPLRALGALAALALCVSSARAAPPGAEPLVAAAIASHVASASRSDCQPSLPAVKVIGNEHERFLSCQGLARAHRFFTRFGYAPALDAPALRMEFMDEVRMPARDGAGAATGMGGARVAALYQRGRIMMTRPSAPWMREEGRSYFKLGYSEELMASVLSHEFTHALSKQFYAYEGAGRAQEEYIAYAQQLSEMNPATRELALGGYPEAQWVFSDELNINDIVHHGGPHGFGVMSYRHFTGPEGGAKMLARIYSGAFKPPSMEMP